MINTNTSENLVYKPVKPFVTDALATFKGEILKQDAKVTINIEESLAVMCLPAYLESSLLNLISNALKYRSEKNKPEILIKAEKYEHWVLISVKDNGIGIDLSKHGAKIFGMYKTFHSNKDARGIGLFITKNQIEAMGGKIDVESELNKGTTFKIWLKHDEI